MIGNAVFRTDPLASRKLRLSYKIKSKHLDNCMPITVLAKLFLHFLLLKFVSSSSSTSSSASMSSLSMSAGGAARERTTRPIVTGTSVLGIKYDGGVMLAADTLASYGTMAKYKDARRLVKVDNTLIGGGGEYSDFQSVVDILQQNALEDKCTSDSLYDETSSNAREIWNYLRAVMYNRRNKMNPLWNDLVIAGFDDKGESFLGWVDKIGTTFEDSIVATGFGSYLAIPLLREKYRSDLNEGEARALLEDCMRVLFYRDCRALNRIQIAKVTPTETLISEPFEIETSWDSASFVQPVADLEGDGGW